MLSQLSLQPKKRLICHYTINGAFLQEVKEAYSTLWQRRNQLRNAARNGLPLSVDVNPWVLQLAEFRRELGQEFSLEETYGYIPQTFRSHSHAGMNPVATLGQHTELYIQLTEFCEQVEEAQYRGTIIRDFPMYAGAFELFDEALQAHERQEAELIRYGLGLQSQQ